jgi:hypothetical protein
MTGHKQVKWRMAAQPQVLEFRDGKAGLFRKASGVAARETVISAAICKLLNFIKKAL